ncbi:alpha/beta hydrolase [Frigidibacter sp. SD6-1]|uniref:alpha/beta hydrolase n=1 Tax=Frigidibacter sp. SD6-1 TaxID=3032581 RepID=UPI0024DFB5F9|nr:alpha/beta hydrolase [Frigidibacter sp. SD6-1]
MSLRLRLATLGARWFVRPWLSSTATPARARRDLEVFSLLIPVPRKTLVHIETGARPVHRIAAGAVRERPVILYFHGGAYVAGSPRSHRSLLARLSALTGLEVVAPAYRLAPEHPAPAAFEDARAAHENLLREGLRPDEIVLAGDSAGGGLALALLAHLCAENLRPAGLVAFSPWADLTMSGASLRENAGRDPLIPAARMEDTARLVAGGLSRADPRLSPLFADVHRPPPVHLQVGSSEVLRDDARRMADRLRVAGGTVRLTEWAGAPHCFQFLSPFVPEAQAALQDAADFIARLSSDVA